MPRPWGSEPYDVPLAAAPGTQAWAPPAGPPAECRCRPGRPSRRRHSRCPARSSAGPRRSSGPRRCHRAPRSPGWRRTGRTSRSRVRSSPGRRSRCPGTSSRRSRAPTRCRGWQARPAGRPSGRPASSSCTACCSASTPSSAPGTPGAARPLGSGRPSPALGLLLLLALLAPAVWVATSLWLHRALAAARAVDASAAPYPVWLAWAPGCCRSSRSCCRPASSRTSGRSGRAAGPGPCSRRSAPGGPRARRRCAADGGRGRSGRSAPGLGWWWAGRARLVRRPLLALRAWFGRARGPDPGLGAAARRVDAGPAGRGRADPGVHRARRTGMIR